MWGQGEKTAFSEPGNCLSPDTETDSTLISDFLPSQIVRNKFLLFASHPVWGVLLQQTKQTNGMVGKEGGKVFISMVIQKMNMHILDIVC